MPSSFFLFRTSVKPSPADSIDISTRVSCEYDYLSSNSSGALLLIVIISYRTSPQIYYQPSSLSTSQQL